MTDKFYKNTGTRSFEDVLKSMDPEWTPPNNSRNQSPSTSTGKGAKGTRTTIQKKWPNKKAKGIITIR